MEPRDYLLLSRRYWKIVLAVVLATLAGTAALTFLPARQYTATTQLFLGVPSRSVSELAQGSDFTEQQMNSYAQVATSPLVLNDVVRGLGLATSPDALAEVVTASVPSNTVILEIAATDRDPAQAARIANAVGQRFAAVVGTLVPQQGASAQSVVATVFAQALPPSAPSSPRVALNLAIGSVSAILLGLGAALLRFATNPRLRNEHDLRAASAAPILGVVPLEPPPAGGSAALLHPGASGARAESIRRLRTNLRFSLPAGGSSSLLVTSAVRGEGKSATALNLAVAMANVGTRVVLVDGNLRQPSLARPLGLKEGPGLSDVLTGDAGPADIVQVWEGSTLHVVTAGHQPSKGSELLDSEAMAALLARLSSTYDIVLVDGPSLLEASDASALSGAASGVLLVVGVDRTPRRQVAEAVDSLATVDAHVLGLVLNKVGPGNDRRYPLDSGAAPRTEPLQSEQQTRQPSRLA
jgi:polysaccharide biosynthesis transport protein